MGVFQLNIGVFEFSKGYSFLPNTVVCHQPVFFVSKPHPTLKHGKLGLENFDQNQNEGHICPLCPSKKKICQRPLPRPKKAIYLFSHPKSPLLIHI